MLITSKDNNKIKDYIKLKQKKFRDETNTFIVEGLHSVIEAFRGGLLIEAILEQDEVIPIECEKVYVTRELIELISSTEHPENVMGLCKKKESTLEGDRILLIDGVQDPGNLGTIIRSSLAFDVDTIVLGKGTTDLYNPKTVRSTQGMLFHINIINGDLFKVIDELKEKNIPIYGTNASGDMIGIAGHPRESPFRQIAPGRNQQNAFMIQHIRTHHQLYACKSR